MGASSRESAEEPVAWYAGYTKARHEKRVDALLQERQVECYLPLVPRERQWHDRKKVVEFPIFPGYLFVRSARSDLSQVLRTPGLVSIVRMNGRPAPVPDEEIENVRRFTAALASTGGTEVETSTLPEEGTPVRVTCGPFRGVQGLVVETRGSDRALIQIGVRVIRQGIKVEVAARHLEKIDDED